MPAEGVRGNMPGVESGRASLFDTCRDSSAFAVVRGALARTGAPAGMPHCAIRDSELAEWQAMPRLPLGQV